MSSNLNYYVTIDSNYRDREQYPLETDFGVSFETKDPTLQYPQGEPVDTTQFFPRMTIDKNFDNSKLKVSNGNITSIAKDSFTNSTLYAGVQKTSGESSNFIIYLDNDIIYSDFQTISIYPIPGIITNFQAFEDVLERPFLFKLNSSNQLDWIVIGALSEPQFQTYIGLNKTQDVQVTINNSGNYLLSFDYKSNLSFFKSYYVNNDVTTVSLGYNIVSPYGNGTSAYVTTAFNTDGTRLFLNDVPWGYHNYYTCAEKTGTYDAFDSSPFNMLPTVDSGKNCIVSDKGNSIYAGINIDNVTPTITEISLDGIDIPSAVNTPVDYPIIAGIPPWTYLSYTYDQYADITPFNINPELNRTILSQSLVICNTTGITGYTGTSIISPVLLMRRLPVRQFYLNLADNYSNSQVYQRYFDFATGTYTISGVPSNTGPLFKTNIGQISTAYFYSQNNNGVGYIFCSNRQVSGTEDRLTAISFQFNSVGYATISLIEEDTYSFGAGTTIHGITATFNFGNIYVFVLRTTAGISYVSTLTYSGGLFASVANQTYASIGLYNQPLFIGSFFSLSAGTVVWASTPGDYTIFFMKFIFGPNTLILNATLFAPVSGTYIITGPRSYYSNNNWYFVLSANNISNTYLIDTSAPTLTFTYLGEDANQSTLSYLWLDQRNYKQYSLGSNPKLAIYNTFNNILHNQVGINNQISSDTIVCNVSSSRPLDPFNSTDGDISAISKGTNNNKFYTTWGSVLQSPILVSSHVYQNLSSGFELPKVIRDVSTFTLNGRFYAVYAYDDFATSPVFFYIYDITDISNVNFIGVVSTNSTILPIYRINSIGYNNKVFILCEHLTTKVIVFDINDILNYTVLDVDTTGSNEKFSNFLLLNNNLYIYQATRTASGFDLSKFLYNGTTFNSVASTSFNLGDTLIVYGVADAFFTLDNFYQIVVIGKLSLSSVYNIYFINFNNISSISYNLTTALTAVGSTINFNVSLQLNLIDFTNLLFINYISSGNQLVGIFKIPALFSNINYIEFLDTTFLTPFSGAKPQFSATWNLSLNKMIFVTPASTYFSTINIYDVTNVLSITQLSSLSMFSYFGGSIGGNPRGLITPNFNINTYLIFIYDEGIVTQQKTGIIDITNPVFAQNYPKATRSETTTRLYGKNPSALVKLNFEGQTQWINGIGDVYPYTGGQTNTYDSQLVNVAGLCLNNSELSLCGSYVWKTKIATINYNNTFENNLLTNPFNAINAFNSCLFKCRTDNGNSELIIPFCGALNTLPTNPINLSDNFCISLNYESSNLYIYIPQTSRNTILTSLSNPITIQKTLNNLATQSSSLVTLTQAGVLNWTSILQSQNINSYVYTYTISSAGNTVAASSTSYLSNVDVYDTNNNIVQTVYPFPGNENSVNYVINTRFYSTGTYIETDSIESLDTLNITPLANYSALNDKILYSNSIFSNKTGAPDSLYYRNKDGTLGHVDQFVGQNIYYDKVTYTTPGIYNLSIPTGCIGIKVKLWGAGGCAPSNSLANFWSAFGGGGGYADTQLTYPEGTQFTIKVGAAGNGGQISLTGTLVYEGGAGGESSYCHSYINNVWNIEAVAPGGGGAGAGATGTIGISTGSYGGSAGYNGNKGFYNGTVNYLIPGQKGINGGGGLGGDRAGSTGPSSPNGPIQNGQNFQNNTSYYPANMGTGGFASFDNSVSVYPFIYSGGGGGDGYGGGGAGDPGIAPVWPDAGDSGGGGGGGGFGDRVVYRFANEPSWFPANWADNDYYTLSPLALAGIFNYGQGGSPTLNILGNYNPTGTGGLAVLYYYYQSVTGTTGAPCITQTAVSVYDYDSTFTDQNLKNYSSLTVYKNSPNINDTFTPYQTGAETGSYTNFYTYILGTGANTPLNKNFLIRNNFFNDDEYTIVLDQKIDTTKLTRTYSLINYDPNSIYFYSSNISRTPINSVVSLTGTTPPTSPLIVNYTSSPINTRDRYYLLCQTSTGSSETVTVTSIVATGTSYYIYYTGTYDCTGTYVYLSKFNKSALWNLQFNPSSIYSPVYYQVTLQRLTVPNRPIKNGPNPGVRYLTDYPYIFLQVYNTDDEGNFDPENINNIYTNNPNGPPIGGYDQNPTAYPNNSVYTIDISTSPGGEANFLFFGSGFIPRLKFTPGYNNIRIRLIDPDGDVILFDNTPVKSSDSVFSGVVDPSLMRLVVQLVFKKAS